MCISDVISSHAVPVTQFEDDESDHLGHLCVTPEMIAKKISSHAVPVTQFEDDESAHMRFQLLI